MQDSTENQSPQEPSVKYCNPKPIDEATRRALKAHFEQVRQQHLKKVRRQQKERPSWRSFLYNIVRGR